MTNKHTQGGWNRNIKPASKYAIIYAGRNTHVAQVLSAGLPESEVEAYCLEQKRTKNSVFFQDADALTFSEQLEQIEAALPNAPSDKILSDLFNIYTGE